MKYLFIIMLLFISIESFSNEECDSLHSVLYRFAVNHKKELTHFNLYQPRDCNNKITDVILTKAWMKTACAYFSTTKPRKTYGRWRKPKYNYGFYLYNTNYPEIMMLPFDKNRPPNEHDHVVVLPSIMKKHKNEHVCDGELKMPLDDSGKVK